MTDQRRETPKAVEGVAGAIAGTAGFAVEGPAGGVAGAAMTPYVLDVVQRTWDELTAWRRGSVAHLVAQAADELGEGAQDLVDGAMATDDGAELLAEAMHAAAATLNERKVAALSRAVANGLADDQARIDDARIMVQALASIEAPHIRVLIALRKYGSVGGTNPAEVALHLNANGQTVANIFVTLERAGFIAENLRQQQQEADKHNRERLENEMRRLPNSGRKGPVFGGRYDYAPRIRRLWHPTDFGVDALVYLGEAAKWDEDEVPED